MHHVIIGAGPAGVVAAEHIRKLDGNCTITLIGDEKEPPYSRMAIPYLLVGNIAEKGTYLRKEQGALSSKGIDVKQGRVASLDTNSKQVLMNSSEKITYDKLLICTGSHPLMPPISGMDLPQVHTCWTLEDARQIIKLAESGSKVILMGAGFIGCIILEALASRRVELTVIEMENRMVPRMMNETTGGMIKSWCISKGVNVLTSSRVMSVNDGSGLATSSGLLSRIKNMLFSPAAVSQAAHPLVITLDNNEKLDADLLICATGVRPNIEFLQGGTLELDHGVVVNEFLQTNSPEVYAAGDVAQGRDFSTGNYDVQAIQPTAVEHGILAATNMVKGNSVEHRGSINMNVLDTLGLVSTSFGLWMGVDGGDSAEIRDEKNYKYMNLQFEGDVLIGASSLGLIQHMGVIRGLIQSRTKLGVWKNRLIADPTRVMEAYLATAQAQSTAAKV